MNRPLLTISIQRIQCVLAVLLLASCNKKSTDSNHTNLSYLEKRANFKTQLLRKGPSPQNYRKESPPAGVEEIHYPSGDLQLKAWIYRPDAPAGTKLPALIYYHGGYAFGAGDLMDCKPFIEAGFIVMTPMLRGENGNPGNFEMHYGEVDDARAALHWLAEQEYVDTDHIYTFGHSAGGIISAMLSLYDEPHLRLTGSSGGLYGQSIMLNDPKAPFDTTSERERELRCLIGNIKDMSKQHIAYVGTEDTHQEVENARAELSQSPGKLEIKILKGDHFSVVPQSFNAFLKVAQADILQSTK